MSQQIYLYGANKLLFLIILKCKAHIIQNLDLPITSVFHDLGVFWLLLFVGSYPMLVK